MTSRGRQRLVVTTACIAVVEEEWLLVVPATVARDAQKSAAAALAFLRPPYVERVLNKDVRDEQERIVLGVVAVDEETVPKIAGTATQSGDGRRGSFAETGDSDPRVVAPQPQAQGAPLPG